MLRVVAGATRSIFTPCTEPLPTLPARSDTAADAPRSSPWPAIVLSAGTLEASTPERSSVAVQWIVTSPLYQPFAFGSVVAEPASSGFVLSMLTCSTVADAALPAVSVAEPEADWFAPWSVSVTSGAHAFTLESASAQVKWTVTGPLFQPLAFAGVRSVVIVGGVLSSFRVTESVPRLPATSSA